MKHPPSFNPHGRYQRDIHADAIAGKPVRVETPCPSCGDTVEQVTRFPATAVAFPEECVTCIGEPGWDKLGGPTGKPGTLDPVRVETPCPSCGDTVEQITCFPATAVAFPEECVTCNQYREDENASLARIHAANCALMVALYGDKP